jgi:hypothetical protein
LAYDVFITILLTAITVVLAALAALVAVVGLGIGALALWGYAGLRDEAKKSVSQAMDDKLREYPSSAEIVKSFRRIEDRAEFIEQMQNQMVTRIEPKPIETPSKPSVEVGGGSSPAQERTKPPEPTIAIYPGEGEANNVRKDAKPSTASTPDTGANTG